MQSKNVLYVVVPLACLVGGMALGWQMKPDQYRVEEKVKVVEVEKQVVVVQEKVKVEVVKVKDVQVVEKWHREKTEERKPDGTVLTKEVEDRNIDSVLKEKETAVEVKVVEVEKQVVVDRVVDRVVEKEPVLTQWHLGVMIGTAPRFDAPQQTPLLLGVEASRRVVGPFFLGGWVMAGSPVVGGFQVTNAALGLKAAVEF